MRTEVWKFPGTVTCDMESIGMPTFPNGIVWMEKPMAAAAAVIAGFARESSIFRISQMAARRRSELEGQGLGAREEK